MKQLKESILSSDFDIEFGYIEYDWFNWPCVYENDEFISGAQNCNTGMYAQLISDDINKLISSAQEHIDSNLNKKLFRDLKFGIRTVMKSLEDTKAQSDKQAEWLGADRADEYRKIYKFIDELFSVPLAQKLMPKFDATNVYLSLDRSYHSKWCIRFVFHKNCINVKDRQSLADEWTKISKKHGIDDINVSNADGRVLIDQFLETDKLQFDSPKMKKLTQASEAYDFEIQIEFDSNRL